MIFHIATHAQVCVTELGLQDQLTAEEFLAEREEALDKLFPQTALMPGPLTYIHCTSRGTMLRCNSMN